MKKSFIIVLAILLLAFSAVCAQETTTETPELNFTTVGDIFNWGDKAEDVYKFLDQYELDLEIDSESSAIVASSESDEEYFEYIFYFDEETEELFMIQCQAAIAEGIDPTKGLEDLIQTYGLDKAEPYNDKDLAEFIAEYDAGMVVAGDGTIAALAASDETEETKAVIALLFADRVYWEKTSAE